jgi:hypothetical protein
MDRAHTEITLLSIIFDEKCTLRDLLNHQLNDITEVINLFWQILSLSNPREEASH